MGIRKVLDEQSLFSTSKACSHIHFNYDNVLTEVNIS